MTGYFTPQTVDEHLNQVFISDWIAIDQVRINVFGAVTEDADPHHVDPEFCATSSPWGKPISFGFLTLSLVTPLLYQVFRYPLDGDAALDGYPASFGTDHLRFVQPVPVGSRIRARVTPKSVSVRKPGQKLIVLGIYIEIEAQERPALVTDWQMIWAMAKAE